MEELMNDSGRRAWPHATVRRVALLGLLALLATSNLDAQQKPILEKALRISGTYADGRIVSIEVAPLRAVLPLTVKERILPADKSPRGHFVELLDSDRKLLMRSVIDDPTLVVMEYEDPSRPGRIVSTEIHPASGTFSTVVAAPERARLIRFRRIAPDQEAAPPEKRIREDLGTFSLPDNVGPGVPVEEGGRS
jgi:hypothetical protein